MICARQTPATRSNACNPASANLRNGVTSSLKSDKAVANIRLATPVHDERG